MLNYNTADSNVYQTLLNDNIQMTQVIKNLQETEVTNIKTKIQLVIIQRRSGSFEEINVQVSWTLEIAQ